MFDRLIITAKNRDFPRLGNRYPIASHVGVLRVAGAGSSAGSNHSELPTYSGMQPASGTPAELVVSFTGATHAE